MLTNFSLGAYSGRRAGSSRWQLVSQSGHQHRHMLQIPDLNLWLLRLTDSINERGMQRSAGISAAAMVLSLSQSVTPVLKKVIVAAALCGAAAISAALLVTDWPVPHSRRTGYFDVTTSEKADLSHIDEWNRAAKAKYGPDASTYASMSSHGLTWVARVGDKVVETRPFGFSVYGFLGVFMVSNVESFPFELSIEPKDPVEPGQTVDKVKARFAKTAPAEALEFGNREWRPAHCHSPKPPEFGFPLYSSDLRVDTSSICLMQSDGGPYTALVGFARVDASFWVRLLSRKVCRILAASWVELMTSQPNAKRPDYVACMLATKAGGSEREVIAARFFEVRDDKTLAVFD